MKTILILRNWRSHPSTKYFFRSSQSCLCWLLYLQVTSRTPSAIDTDKHKFTLRFQPSKYKRGFTRLKKWNHWIPGISSAIKWAEYFRIATFERSNHSLSIESSQGSQCIHRFKLRKVFNQMLQNQLCCIKNPAYALRPRRDLRRHYEFLELENRMISK